MSLDMDQVYMDDGSEVKKTAKNFFKTKTFLGSREGPGEEDQRRTIEWATGANARKKPRSGRIGHALAASKHNFYGIWSRIFRHRFLGKFKKAKNIFRKKHKPRKKTF